MTLKIKFTKMQAYGNDYVYIDAIHQKIKNPGELSVKVSDRHFGIGSDGMVLICPSQICDFRMRIFNPDGTEAEMCGNALRSTAKFVFYHGMTQKELLTIETYGGNQTVKLQVENGEVTDITANIGKPRLEAEQVPVLTDRMQFIGQKLRVEDREFPASSISWGNPHTVLWVDDVNDTDVHRYGPQVEHLDCFPKRTNVTFAQMVDEKHINIREWERGTGETIGCGTGCCSAVVVGNLLGYCGRSVEVKQIGGTLKVDWLEDGTVSMTGPSQVVFQGEYEDGQN